TSAERLPIKTYTAADGLGHNNVHRIVSDSRGFLWFCTFEGLSRFDGYTFTTYTTDHGLPSPVINDLLETREGQCWVATDNGVCRFNPNGTTNTRAETSVGNGSAAQPMLEVYFPGDDPKSRAVKRLVQDSRGVIWCATANGLYTTEQRSDGITFHLAHVG